MDLTVSRMCNIAREGALERRSGAQFGVGVTCDKSRFRRVPGHQGGGPGWKYTFKCYQQVAGSESHSVDKLSQGASGDTLGSSRGGHWEEIYLHHDDSHKCR